MIGEVTTVLGVYNERPAYAWSDDFAPIPFGPGIFQAYAYGGYIYCVGAALLESPALPGVQRYHPATDTWTSMSDIDSDLGEGDGWETHGAGVGAYIYSVNSSRIHKYDIAGDVWTNLGLNPVGFFSFGCYAAVGTDIFMFHGTSVEKLNTLTNTLTTLGSWPRAREGVGAAYNGNDGLIYLMGGSSSFSDNFAETYNPSTGVFTNLTDIPTGHEDTSAVAFDGKIWVVGGEQGGLGTAVSIYDPTSATWSVGPTLTYYRDDAKTVVFGGKIFCFGGEDGGEYNGTGRVLATEVLNNPPPASSTVEDARFDQPFGLAIDPTDTDVLYVAEVTTSEARIRRCDLAADTVTTLLAYSVDNGTSYYDHYMREGIASVAVSADGHLFALTRARTPDANIGPYRHYEVWRVYPNGTHDVLFQHDSDSVPITFEISSLVVDSNDDVYLYVHGFDSGTSDYFNGIMRVVDIDTLELYAGGGWGPDYDAYNEADGPRLAGAIINTSDQSFPYTQFMAIDSDDNIWVYSYRCVRRIDGTTGAVTTPLGVLRDFNVDDQPLDGALEPIGGARCRTNLQGYGGTFIWAIATTWGTADQHVFTFDDYGGIFHAAINADVCGPYLSGERVVRDSPLGRHAASYQSHGMAYAGGYVYFTERYGPTVRRLEVGGAGSAEPRGQATAGTSQSRVRRPDRR